MDVKWAILIFCETETEAYPKLTGRLPEERAKRGSLWEIRLHVNGTTG
jgi:hypothetical protein